MTINEAMRRRLIESVAQSMFDHVGELTALDQAIGDGDHGLNMKRGFEAVMADIDTHAAKPLPDALSAIGMALVMKVGGASGPLYGTLFMTLGKALPEQFGQAELAEAFAIAVDAVAKRGKSEAGQKTMLDVLMPVSGALASGCTADEIVKVAGDSAEATIPMLAKRGRASFLGERSIGHMDPGSRSCQLLVEAVAGWLAGRS
jgi:dihydroxyacetone kinase-like protein